MIAMFKLRQIDMVRHFFWTLVQQEEIASLLRHEKEIQMVFCEIRIQEFINLVQSTSSILVRGELGSSGLARSGRSG